MIERYRGIQALVMLPTSRNVLVGPNNAGKSTVLEALDLVLHSGMGRTRAAPTELDYFDRKADAGFSIEVVLGDLSTELLAQVAEGLEGWKAESGELVPEVDGNGIEAVVRIRARGTDELEVLHEFAKPEIEGQRFGPRLRKMFGWVFDGRSREPGRQLAFYQGGVLDQLFSGIDLDPALGLLRDALVAGADSVNADASVATVLAGIGSDLKGLGLGPGGDPDFEAGFVSNRELLQTLRLALPGVGSQAIPLIRHGRGAQRLVLLAVLLRLAQGRATNGLIGGFEEPEEAVEPLRQVQAARMLRGIAEAGGQVFISTHSPEIVRAFDSSDVVLMDRAPGLTATRVRFTSSARHGYERRLDMPLVRALFVRFPVIVEGVSDRSVFAAFWDALRSTGDVPQAEQIGLEAISAEGSSHLPMTMQVLSEIGKPVTGWIELDDRVNADRSIDQGNAHCLLVYPDDPLRNNLERALAQSASIESLALAMTAVAEDRGYGWEPQRDDLMTRSHVITDQDVRDKIKGSTGLLEALTLASDAEARSLVAECLAAKAAPAPFEIKGGRSARVFAESLVATGGVPAPFSRAYVALWKWIESGAPRGTRIDMTFS